MSEQQPEAITLEEFVQRFTTAFKRYAGFETFADGMSVKDYCLEIAPTYFEDKDYRAEGPESCAIADAEYLGEE